MALRVPLLGINLKCYRQGTSNSALRLARVCQRESERSGICLIIAAQTSDIALLAKIPLPIFAQHVDGISYGARTGWILPEAVAAAGAVGTFLNHSEHKLKPAELAAAIKGAKRAGLKTIVFATDLKEARAVAALKPDFVAIEPPELIGGKISVSSARPELVKNVVAAIGKEVQVLCGAGIHSKEDVAAALRLGAVGALVSSGFVLAPRPRAALRELLGGFVD